MSHALWKRPAENLRGISPRSGGAVSFTAQLFHQGLALQAQRSGGSLAAGEIASLRYRGPNGIGRHFLESPDDATKLIDVPSVPNLTGFTPGQFVTIAQTQSGPIIVAPPTGGKQNASQHPRSVQSGEIDLVSVESASPATAPEGVPTAVSIFGVGFKSSPVDTFTPKKPDPTDPTNLFITDTLVTLDTIVFVSTTEVTTTVTIATSAGIDYPVRLDVTRS